MGKHLGVGHVEGELEGHQTRKLKHQQLLSGQTEVLLYLLQAQISEVRINVIITCLISDAYEKPPYVFQYFKFAFND